jgi:hypothetical protein
VPSLSVLNLLYSAKCSHGRAIVSTAITNISFAGT